MFVSLEVMVSGVFLYQIHPQCSFFLYKLYSVEYNLFLHNYDPITSMMPSDRDWQQKIRLYSVYPITLKIY